MVIQYERMIAIPLLLLLQIVNHNLVPIMINSVLAVDGFTPPSVSFVPKKPKQQLQKLGLAASTVTSELPLLFRKYHKKIV